MNEFRERKCQRCVMKRHCRTSEAYIERPIFMCYFDCVVSLSLFIGLIYRIFFAFLFFLFFIFQLSLFRVFLFLPLSPCLCFSFSVSLLLCRCRHEMCIGVKDFHTFNRPHKFDISPVCLVFRSFSSDFRDWP